MKAAEWRGSARATKPWQARKMFELAKLSEKDTFADLGCGDGRVCIWAARRCNYAIGIECHPSRARTARKSMRRKRLKNAVIISARFENVGLPSNNLVLYCTPDIEVEDFEAWNGRSRRRVRIVTVGPPPVPIKPVGSDADFFLTRFPYSSAKTGEELCYSITKRKGATLQDVIKKLDRLRMPTYYIREYEHDFRKYFEQNSTIIQNASDKN